MTKTTSEANREIAFKLSNNLPRLLQEFYRDYDRRVLRGIAERGYSDIRPSHSQVLSNLGTGSVRVTELAERAKVTQQAMGKLLKELERLGYVDRAIDSSDKRAKEIRFTERGLQLVADALEVVDEVRAHYVQKIGARELDDLEQRLRQAVDRLELDYLPESWADQN
ncbi:MarR family winged helix-turn-helix transcriptional regulator [Mangrovimicrobium sediminis]|uniref:MarR family winged helix-turn-helix transcriptional regulator n=1 Tax=Mangrovimicrobium sediminis TaxID=2562682 RepID=UPI001436B638|nr:MarR family transcriptional regulator [Haliea sp. SAOS-164]